MFDVGMGELALIGLLALIVLGPKRLPEVARTAGLWVGRVRRFVASVKEDFDRELRTEELTELRKLQQELTETRELIQHTSADTVEGLQRDVDADPLGDVLDKQPKRKSPKHPRTAKSKKTAARTKRTSKKKSATRKKDGRARKPRSR